MSKEIRITKHKSSESLLEAAVDTVLKLGTFGFAGLPSSDKRYDAEVDGKYIGTFSSKEKAFKAASKK